MTEQPPLFADAYSEPPELTTQVTRMPGTADAPCVCGRNDCEFPWCQHTEPKVRQ